MPLLFALCSNAVVRWRAFGLIQLLVLAAHLCASPFAIPAVESLTPWTNTTYERSSTLRETLPFAPEEKVRVRSSSATPAGTSAVSFIDLPARRLLERDLDLPCLRLSGFEPPACTRTGAGPL